MPATVYSQPITSQLYEFVHNFHLYRMRTFTQDQGNAVVQSREMSELVPYQANEEIIQTESESARIFLSDQRNIYRG